MDTFNTDPVSTVYVDDDYTSPPCGSYICGYNAFATIQEGVAAVAAGGTVNVAAGNYTAADTILVNKAATITGPLGGGALIQGTDPADITIFNIAASNVTLQNLEITHAALSCEVRNMGRS